jgi:hypothetical protein
MYAPALRSMASSSLISAAVCGGSRFHGLSVRKAGAMLDEIPSSGEAL